MKDEKEWIVHFLNDASDEQIMNIFQASLEDSVREDIVELIRGKKDKQS